MLTTGSIQSTGTTVKCSALFKTSLFQWDDGNKTGRKLGKTTSVYQKVAFTFLVIYCGWEAVYHVYRIWSNYGEKDPKRFQSYLKMIAHATSRVIGIGFGIITALKAEEASYLYNQILFLNKRFQGFYTPEECPDRCRKLFRTFRYFGCLHALLISITYVHENKDIRYWHGTLLPPSIQPFCIPLFFLLEYWVSLAAILAPVLCGFILVTYCYVMQAWIRILTRKQRKIDRLSRNISGLQNGTFIYFRSLQLLHRVFNNCYSAIMTWALSGCMAILVSCLTLSIRLSPNIPPPGNLQFPVGSIALMMAFRYVIVPMADFTAVSQEFIGGFRNLKGNRALSKKQQRSLQPFKATCFTFFAIGRETIMEYYSQVVGNTVTVLLMT